MRKFSCEGLMKMADPVPTTRPLTFLQRNRSALSGGALAALLGAGLGAALPSKGDTRRKRNVRRLVKLVLYAAGFAAAGAGVGAVHDRAHRSSRVNVRHSNYSDISTALMYLKRLHSQGQQQFMHRTGGTPANSFSELGSSWNIGSGGYLLDPWTYFARLNGNDIMPNTTWRAGIDDDISSKALAAPYRYGILRHSEKARTPVSVALPEYDTDDAPGLVGIKTVRTDPSDFLMFGPNDVFTVASPEGKAVLRDLVMNGKPITNEVLSRIKGVRGEWN